MKAPQPVARGLFPGDAMGAVNGAVGSAIGAGAALFPWLAGRIYDQSATYTLAYQLAAVAILISTVALWLALKVAKKKV
jgi:nitrate/nitrite transporter NarK